ncbi:uncharacterized protein ATNIH1004_006477 [Aspergillus tanneri]|uniref:Uncharacterized protein n=1 Tax=Aspergillus tanneri TaxID=1220188 RepID=A0A5M9MPF2_9EURO|nr:uncharacterized protein ATNIH1004_006477 [Aspergillus tanneri]KAA8647776.1 hypothetical protein ATNIH1004_006477 [Aspergillus tanneri]
MGHSLEKLERLFRYDMYIFDTVTEARRMSKYPELSDELNQNIKAKVDLIEDSGNEKRVT